MLLYLEFDCITNFFRFLNLRMSMNNTHYNQKLSSDILEFATNIGCKELYQVLDKDSGLHGFVAIHCTKRGPALGGCRFLPYISSNLAAIDAMRLAKGMALKSAMANLPLGGGKTVLINPTNSSNTLNFDRFKALQAFGKFLNTLKGRYITAVDSGTSVTDMDHIAKETAFVTSTSKFNYSVADPSIATARGVLKGILAAVKFKFATQDLQDVHVAVQGVGNVGYYLVKFLHHLKARISICDINSQLIDRCVADFNKINVISDPEKIYQINADVFSPCALGGILNSKNIAQLKVKIIAGAANNQLAAEDQAEHLHKKDILYAPDFVINAGGVIYVAGPVLKQTETENLQKIDDIYNTLLNIFTRHVKENINTYNLSYAMALEKLNV